MIAWPLLFPAAFILAAILATHAHHNPRVNVETLPGIVGRFLFARFLDGRRTNHEVDQRMAVPLPVEREELTEPLPEIDGHQIGSRWPVRQTPMLSDLADNEGPANWEPELNPRHWCEPPDWYVWTPDRPDPVTEPARHGSDEVAGGLLTYPGRHRFGVPRLDVTAEFELIIRSVVFDDDLVDVTDDVWEMAT